MKARVPFTVRQTEEQRRKYATWINILISCYTLHRYFGFGKERLRKFLVGFGLAMKDIADLKFGGIGNKTWQDELFYWGDQMGLNEVWEAEQNDRK